MPEISKVIENGYCIGCGACAYVEPDVFKINLSEYGTKEAKSLLDDSEKSNGLADKVCPFSEKSKNESQIAEEQFVSSKLSYDNVIGFHKSLHAGHVVEGKFRADGSSGGMVSWLIKELFERDEIDYVIHVKEKSSDELFSYSISSSLNDALTASKSKYYPISMEKVLDQVKSREGRYLFIGIPCFVKALRNVSIVDDIISERIKYIAGLVCGHLKSTYFSYNYSMQLDVFPDELAKIDFRHMVDNHEGPANQYFVKVTDRNGYSKVRQNIGFYGYLWGHGFFKYKACDYCDDIFAETADICFGDAWIKPYVDDPEGDNIVVVRNESLARIVNEAIAYGKVNLDEVDASDIKRSQEAGIRHRRDGVIARVKFKKLIKSWHPKKRYIKNSFFGRSDLLQKTIYVYREYISFSSMKYFRLAIDEKNYDLFKNRMKIIMFIYDRVLYFSFGKVINKLKKIFK